MWGFFTAFMENMVKNEADFAVQAARKAFFRPKWKTGQAKRVSRMATADWAWAVAPECQWYNYYEETRLERCSLTK